MSRSFWDSYQTFLAEAQSWTGEAGEQAAVEAVRRRARQNRAEFLAWVKSCGWGTAYVERHLLYVAGHPEPVRELLRRGYPLRRISLRAVNPEVLEQALAHRDWRARVDRLFQPAPLPEWASRPVWLFDSTPELRRLEALAVPIAGALVEITCPLGGLVIDPMAGQGSIVRAARESGRQAWGSDLRPRSPDIVRADISELCHHVQSHTADALMLHPPTFESWSVTAQELCEVPASEHYAAYLDFIAGLLRDAGDVLKPGGKVVLIARPPRRGQVYLAPFELALGEQGLRLMAYRLAVSRDGREDWHFFIAQSS
ncbi:DNA methylase N-4/N-6 domain-containing protein [Deinococcus cavernae]|uniref:DNA methylase N-4/N-6 domain-containing protein n=1 Tax=Deinococcus cavernae TaxID=2320857 RepID=A0A418VI12_9DEIO|nr:DNA methylase N-4/N-6 domain-containing protein [Deinococcus cavernae]RJF75685.1 DNA methylase N-4/N-6 domain-containing protein [Deinococcus cavernae]